MKDIKFLTKNPVDGIRIFIDNSNTSVLEAEIDGPNGTPYESGVFRLKLIFPSDYPNTPPKGFLTKIFHPNVSDTGAICVNTLKKDWTPELGVKHILLVIRCLLIYPNPASALNEEAGKLILDHYNDFAKHAKLLTNIHAKPIKSKSSNNENKKSIDDDSKTNDLTSKRKLISKKVKKRVALRKKNLKRL